MNNFKTLSEKVKKQLLLEGRSIETLFNELSAKQKKHFENNIEKMKIYLCLDPTSTDEEEGMFTEFILGGVLDVLHPITKRDAAQYSEDLNVVIFMLMIYSGNYIEPNRVQGIPATLAGLRVQDAPGLYSTLTDPDNSPLERPLLKQLKTDLKTFVGRWSTKLDAFYANEPAAPKPPPKKPKEPPPPDPPLPSTPPYPRVSRGDKTDQNIYSNPEQPLNPQFYNDNYVRVVTTEQLTITRTKTNIGTPDARQIMPFLSQKDLDSGNYRMLDSSMRNNFSISPIPYCWMGSVKKSPAQSYIIDARNGGMFINPSRVFMVANTGHSLNLTLEQLSNNLSADQQQDLLDDYRRMSKLLPGEYTTIFDKEGIKVLHLHDLDAYRYYCEPQNLMLISGSMARAIYKAIANKKIGIMVLINEKTPFSKYVVIPKTPYETWSTNEKSGRIEMGKTIYDDNENYNSGTLTHILENSSFSVYYHDILKVIIDRYKAASGTDADKTTIKSSEAVPETTTPETWPWLAGSANDDVAVRHMNRFLDSSETTRMEAKKTNANGDNYLQFCYSYIPAAAMRGSSSYSKTVMSTLTYLIEYIKLDPMQKNSAGVNLISATILYAPSMLGQIFTVLDRLKVKINLFDPDFYNGLSLLEMMYISGAPKGTVWQMAAKMKKGAEADATKREYYNSLLEKYPELKTI